VELSTRLSFNMWAILLNVTSLALIKVMSAIAVKSTLSRGNKLNITHRVKENSQLNHLASGGQALMDLMRIQEVHVRISTMKVPPEKCRSNPVIRTRLLPYR
jgi:hypothetical protein